MFKNKSYIGISFIVLIFGIYAIPKIIDRFQSGDVVKQDRLNSGITSEKGPHVNLMTIGKAPKFSLTDQNGKTVTNEDYLGKVYVVEFFFSTCPTICPVMNQNMLIIEKEFGTHKNFGIASFTINPKYDTPEVLKEHAKQLGVTSPNWHFLTGDHDYIYNLANKGFNIYAGESAKAGDAGFEHSGYFALVDKTGKIRSRKDKNGKEVFKHVRRNVDN